MLLNINKVLIYVFDKNEESDLKTKFGNKLEYNADLNFIKRKKR